MGLKFTEIKWLTAALMIFAIGSCFGWLGFLIFGDMASICQIYYVSQKEILRLEKERVKDSEEKGLFCGQTEQVMELIKSSANKYIGPRSKLIFTVDELGSGQGLHSISKEVHALVIERLKADQDYKADRASLKLDKLTTNVKASEIHKFKELKNNYLKQQLKGEKQ